jgi:HMG box factor
VGVGGVYHHPPPQGPPGFDESLRLPPLQVPPSPKPPQQHSQQHTPRPLAGGSESVARANVSKAVAASSPIGAAALRRPDTSLKSVEAMVMSIPFHNKMSVLRKISPALALTPSSSGAPSPVTPSPGTTAAIPQAEQPRGVIIAVEGATEALRSSVARAITRALEDSGEMALRTWESDSEVAQKGGGDDMFAAYLRVMTGWHANAREMVQHVRGGAGEDKAAAKMAAEASAAADDTVSRRGSQGGIVNNPPRRESQSSNPPREEAQADLAPPTSVEDARSTPRPAPTQRHRFPVALLPRGFSLTISDQFACTTPIADEYSPVDHWQWMATLWRGIVGADLVVHVSESGGGGGGDGASAEAGSFVDATRAATEGVVFVRVADPGGVDDKVERRVAFEVVEWVRGRRGSG